MILFGMTQHIIFSNITLIDNRMDKHSLERPAACSDRPRCDLERKLGSLESYVYTTLDRQHRSLVDQQMRLALQRAEIANLRYQRRDNSVVDPIRGICDHNPLVVDQIDKGGGTLAG